MELEPGQREAWIAALPEGDSHLGPMLQEMLAEQDADRTRGFLSSLATLPNAEDEETAAAGDLVGPTV